MVFGFLQKHRVFTSILALSICMCWSPLAKGAADGKDIGVAAAVKPAATGQRPEQSQRVLKVGIDMIRNERIVTRPEGRAQILFRDGTTLTVGPDSDVTLDEFVYDDNSSTGTLVMSTTKGLLRLVGGKISKKTPIKIKTPTATVGIRGGITIVEIAPDGKTDAMFLFGQDMTVETDGKTQTAVRPNTQISVNDRGNGPTKPVVNNNPVVLRETLGRLEAPRDGPSAVDVVVVDQAFSGSRIEQFGSQEGATNLAPKRGAPPPPPPPGTFAGFAEKTEQQTAFTNNTSGAGANGPTFQVSGRFRESDNIITGGQDGNPTQDEAFSTGTIGGGLFNLVLNNNEDGTLPIQPGSFTFAGVDPSNDGGTASGRGFFEPTEQVFFYEIQDDAVPSDRVVIFGGVPSLSIPTTGRTRYKVRPDYFLDSNHLFTRRDFGGDVGPMDNGAEGIILWGNGAPGVPPLFAARSLAIVGTRDNQQSTMSVGSGIIDFDDNNRPHIIGEQIGTARIDGADPFLTIGDLASVDDAAGNDFFGTGSAPFLFAIDSSDVNTNDVVLDNGVDQINKFFVDPVAFNPLNILVRDVDQPSVNPATTEDLLGFTAGIAEIADFGGMPVARQPVAGNDGSAISVPDPFGVVIRKDAGTSTIDADFTLNAFNAQPSPTTSLDLFLPLGDVATTFGHSILIDDDQFGFGSNDDHPSDPFYNMVPGTAEIAVLTVDGPDQFFNVIPAGVSLCSCPFLKWGFWGGEVSDGTNEGAYFHLANWVAGKPAADTAISALTGANVSYSGHVSATVRSTVAGNEIMHNAIGRIDMTYTFGGSQSGNFNITDLDGANYDGAVMGFPGAESRFGGTNLPATGRDVTIQGAFYEGNGIPNAHAGGQITIESTSPDNYFAAGIFAMDKAP